MAEEKNEAENAEATAPAKASGIFGPLTNLINQARQVHPAAGYLLIILALFAVGAAIYEMLGSYVGEGGLPDLLRIVLFTVLLLLFLMLLVAFFADFISPSQRQQEGLQLRRGILLIVMAAGGSALGWLASGNCQANEIVLGGNACTTTDTIDTKAEIITEAPPPEEAQEEPVKEEDIVEPEPPKMLAFGGYVNNRKIAEAPIKDLKARVRFTTQLFDAEMLPGNIFTVELPREAVDGTVYVSIRGSGFKPIHGKPVKILSPIKGTENINHIWDLLPRNKPPGPVVPGKKLVIPREYLQKLERKAVLIQKK